MEADVAGMDSVKCLKRRVCLPVGGRVWERPTTTLSNVF
jgi:hypothetical protein